MRDIRDEFKVDYSGGPPRARDQARAWLSPRGGTVADGIRLAGINVVGIVVAAIILTLGRLIDRLLRHLIDVPFVIFGFFLLLAIVAVALFGWHIYARAHVQAARERGRSPRPDIFGGIGAIPFGLVGLTLTGTGLLRLLFAMITFSSGRAGDALRTFGTGVLFFALAVAVIFVARAAVDRDS